MAGLDDPSASRDALALVRRAICDEFAGRIAVTTSFGAESAVLLDLVAQVDPATPVIFVDTRRHFPETLQYGRELASHLGLRDVRTVAPDPARLLERDPNGILAYHDSDACCFMRRVEPLAEAMAGFDAWITGRKRYHGAERAVLPAVERVGGLTKINPLAGWTRDDVDEAFARRGLPRHPMVADGFLSIGCMPCTQRADEADGVRSGRWAESAKTECGIHGAAWLRRRG